MKVDTLDYVTDGVLSIEYKNGRQRLVAFLSKFLNETERNYKIYDKEMLMVIKEQWISSLAEIEGLEVDIVEKIKKARSKDKKIVRVVEEMKKAEVKVL